MRAFIGLFLAAFVAVSATGFDSQSVRATELEKSVPASSATTALQKYTERTKVAEYSCSNTCRNGYTICYGNAGNDRQIAHCKKQFNDCMYGC